MKTLPSCPRGDLRIASFLLVLVTGAWISTATLADAATQAYTIRLSVGASGFEPKRVPVPLGTVHFVVTAREGDHCFAIPALDVEKRVRVSAPLQVDVVFEREGEFPFLCCVEGPRTAEVGVIAVTPEG